MILIAAISAALPTGISMIVFDPSMVLLGSFALLLVVVFLWSLGFGALLQSSNCGGVKDMKRVAQNAGIATGILGGFLLIPAVKIPWLHNLASASYGAKDEGERVTIDMGFWAGWGALYGFAVAGTLSTTC